MTPDLNPVPDGEKTAEMACTCVLALVAGILVLALTAYIIMYGLPAPR